MKNKTLAVVLAGLLALGAVACGVGAEDGGDTAPAASEAAS